MADLAIQHPLQITAKRLANEMQIPLSWDAQRKAMGMLRSDTP